MKKIFILDHFRDINLVLKIRAISVSTKKYSFYIFLTGFYNKKVLAIMKTILLLDLIEKALDLILFSYMNDSKHYLQFFLC